MAATNFLTIKNRPCHQNHHTKLFSLKDMNKSNQKRTELAPRVGLNSIYFETIEKQYKYYTNLSCHGLSLLAVWPGKVGRGGRRQRDRVQ